MSEPLQLLLPLADDETRELVRQRLLFGLKFFQSHTLRPEFTRAQAKLALLLVRVANPRELFSADETALIESGMRQALKRQQKRGSAPRRGTRK